MESATDDNVWLIDRLTGSVCRCKAPERGKASCDTEIATGSIGERESRERSAALNAIPESPEPSNALPREDRIQNA
jgi:hypothetical protein